MSSPYSSPVILLCGSEGMLSTDIRVAVTSTWGDSHLISLSKADLDITSTENIESVIKKIKPNIVINGAAYTNVDLAESEKEKCFALNTEAPVKLANVCAHYNAKLIHFSTDQVFDGKSDKPYTETDTPNPINTYGLSKWEGEKAVLKYQDNLVIRVQWLYGKRKNRFTQLKEKSHFTPVIDQFGAPTWTLSVAMTTLELISKKASGLFHFSYDDYASWAEVYQFIKESMGYGVTLNPVSTEELKLPAQRPKFSVLSNKKILETLSVQQMGSWKTALLTFLSGVKH